MFDLLITGGTVVDGGGGEPFAADVAVAGDRIVAIGTVEGEAKRTIDATGKLVTPGFVDIHTHLDAQIGWDPMLSSTCWQGVTSLVLGNCGVTFAPCRPEDRGYLAGLMESVEDIPAETTLAGLPWDWETYGEYMATLDRLPKGLNVGGMVGHCAVRYYVMGERSLEKDPATPEEIAAMVDLVGEAMDGGALGFSTSRTVGHRVPDGRMVPGTWAKPDELLAIADVMGQRGGGVFELAPRLGELDGMELTKSRREMEWMAEATKRTGRPLTFALAQNRILPELHTAILGLLDEAVDAGGDLWPQTTARSIGFLFGVKNRMPFATPAWSALEALDADKRLAVLDDAEQRRQLVAEGNERGPSFDAEEVFFVGATEARYANAPEDSLAGIAAANGETPTEAFVRLSLETEGRALFNYPFLNQSMGAVDEMLGHPRVVLGLGDSGAHVGSIMDAGWSTFFLSHWVRDRRRFTIAEGIRRLTSEPAAMFGLRERGSLSVGSFADINVIDLPALRLLPPDYVHDFPLGAGRFVQESVGYDATIVNGCVFTENGTHSGAFPGVMLRR